VIATRVVAGALFSICCGGHQQCLQDGAVQVNLIGGSLHQREDGVLSFVIATRVVAGALLSICCGCYELCLHGAAAQVNLIGASSHQREDGVLQQ
jgi:hypothetical protein